MPDDNVYSFAHAAAAKSAPLASNLITIGSAIYCIGLGLMLLTSGIKGAARMIDAAANKLGK